jgi:hypothetical protein
MNYKIKTKDLQLIAPIGLFYMLLGYIVSHFNCPHICYWLSIGLTLTGIITLLTTAILLLKRAKTT